MTKHDKQQLKHALIQTANSFQVQLKNNPIHNWNDTAVSSKVINSEEEPAWLRIQYIDCEATKGNHAWNGEIEARSVDNIPKSKLLDYQDMQKRSTIILIGGGSATGKSTLAQQLGQELGINWFSVDDIRIAIQQTHEPDHQVNFFLQENVFVKNEVDYMVEQHKQVSQITCQGLKAVIDHHTMTNQSVIIEGDDILPEFAMEIQSEHQGVKTTFLYELDKNIIKGNITNRGRHTDQLSDEQLVKIVEFTQADNQRILDSAGEYNLSTLPAQPHQTLLERVKKELDL